MCDLIVETAHETEDEKRVRGLLVELLARYDTSRWHFTDRVVIDETAIPHSHPVLTLSTRVMGRSRTGLLSSFLHEQLHWYLDRHEDVVFRAVDDLRILFPAVPSADEGWQGRVLDPRPSRSELAGIGEPPSCRREGGGRCPAEPSSRWTGVGWIYHQVFDRHGEIGEVVRRHGLHQVLCP